MKDFLSKFWRAAVEFSMLAPGDRILVGLSGGKDSTFLLHCLSKARKILPFPIEVGACTLDPMFTADFPQQRLADLCRSLEVQFYYEAVNINEVIQQKKYKSPCFSCAYFRRAATNRIATTHGYNKVALGHHHDDAVETFLMNLMTSGQLSTFLPVTHLSRSKIDVIRPLIYYREYEIKSYIKKMGLEPIKSPCPYNGCTKREDMKNLLKFFSKEVNAEAYEHFGAAMRLGSIGDLWPSTPDRADLAKKHRAFWQQRQ